MAGTLHIHDISLVQAMCLTSSCFEQSRHITRRASTLLPCYYMSAACLDISALRAWTPFRPSRVHTVSCCWAIAYLQLLQGGATWSTATGVRYNRPGSCLMSSHPTLLSTACRPRRPRTDPTIYWGTASTSSAVPPGLAFINKTLYYDQNYYNSNSSERHVRKLIAALRTAIYIPRPHVVFFFCLFCFVFFSSSYVNFAKILGIRHCTRALMQELRLVKHSIQCQSSKSGFGGQGNHNSLPKTNHSWDSHGELRPSTKKSSFICDFRVNCLTVLFSVENVSCWYSISAAVLLSVLVYKAFLTYSRHI